MGCWSPFACFLLAILLMISTTYAYDFYPGGNNGWVEKPSESYNVWAGRNRFQVNDSIVFKYKKGEDSVLLVSRRDYDLCNLKNPIEKLEGGDSVFHFDRSGPFFFVSGKPGRCTRGQKLFVVVMAERKKSAPAPTPPPASPPPPPEADPPRSPSPSPTLPPSPSPSPSPSSSEAPSPSPLSSSSPSPSPSSSSEAPSPSLSSKSPSSPQNAPSPAPTPAAPSSPSSPPNAPSLAPAPTPAAPSSPSSSPNAPLLAPTPAAAPSSGYVTTFSRLSLAVLVVFLGCVVLV